MDFDNLLENINNELSQARKKCLEHFQKFTKSFFEKHPEIKTFSWMQYKPYFNDRDPCEFEVYLNYPIVNGVEPYEDEYDEALSPAVKKLGSFLKGIDECVMEQVFGSHSKITISKEGILVEHHDHS